MNQVQSTESNARQGLIALFLSFFGVAAAIVFLPKLLKYLSKKYIFGFIGETVAIVFTGFITEKIVEWLAGNRSSQMHSTQKND